jgi:hypothetical protein
MNNIIIDGMSFTLPLFIMAIGGIYSERSGITNLALEGLQGMGAFIGALAAYIAVNQLRHDAGQRLCHRLSLCHHRRRSLCDCCTPCCASASRPIRSSAALSSICWLRP